MLKGAFEAAGWAGVLTVLSSGHVVFTAVGSPASLRRRAEDTLRDALGRAVAVHLRQGDELHALLDEEPFAGFKIEPGATPVVTFLREAPVPGFRLPSPRDGVHILAVRQREILTAYVPRPNGPRFMVELERAFGTDQTSRTWETLKKCAAAT